jgi:hypothetical protein
MPTKSESGLFTESIASGGVTLPEAIETENAPNKPSETKDKPYFTYQAKVTLLVEGFIYFEGEIFTVSEKFSDEKFATLLPNNFMRKKKAASPSKNKSQASIEDFDAYINYSE